MKTMLKIAISAALLCAAAAPPVLAQGYGNTGPGIGGQCVRGAGPSLVGRSFGGVASWADGESKTWRITFNADCTATYSYEGQTYRNAVWSQQGARFVMDTNGGYAFYVGTLKGRTLSGTMVNVSHNTGTFRFTAR